MKPTQKKDSDMKNEIVKNTLETIADVVNGKKRMSVQASTCGHLVEEWLREYENNADNDIRNATEKEVSEAYDECVEFGCENITVEEVLREIASHAACNDEHASIDHVSIY